MDSNTAPCSSCQRRAMCCVGTSIILIPLTRRQTAQPGTRSKNRAGNVLSNTPRANRPAQHTTNNKRWCNMKKAVTSGGRNEILQARGKVRGDDKCNGSGSTMMQVWREDFQTTRIGCSGLHALWNHPPIQRFCRQLHNKQIDVLEYIHLCVITCRINTTCPRYLIFCQQRVVLYIQPYVHGVQIEVYSNHTPQEYQMG